jgi:hypothetical protein
MQKQSIRHPLIIVSAFAAPTVWQLAPWIVAAAIGSICWLGAVQCEHPFNFELCAKSAARHEQRRLCLLT